MLSLLLGNATADEAALSLDNEVQDLKKAVQELNRDLFLLEEELLYPASTQVAVFVSLDTGEFLDLDSVELKINNKEVTHYLYTEREREALRSGGVQRLYVGNLKAGEHELVAFFNGIGPHERKYKRGTNLSFEKTLGPKYIELRVVDSERSRQPEFVVREWD
ncbi:MAG: AraC family transcriptional regulator [Gammaproteobacteria bacterium]|nr:AraC family transcriptional regulator [Gammaproteobacteria bacterium]NNF61782.1 AraC family transcriptional regulator [Gammaproteobacteria bacterium]NNM20449.1 AraC family transcriptional regulator [Gammaproteobacteria bacterium]